MSDAPQETATKPPLGASAKGGRGEGLPQLPDAGVFEFAPIAMKPSSVAATTAEPRMVEVASRDKSAKEAKALSAKPLGSMFEALVSGENDLVGFVAYGFYKQNKRDFLNVFEQAHARAPDAGEIRAYMTGEATARRVSTYRHLAENFLASYGEARPSGEDGLDAVEPAILARPKPPVRTLTQFFTRPTTARNKRGPGWLAAAYIAFLILFLAGMVVLIRNGFSPLGGFGR